MTARRDKIIAGILNKSRSGRPFFCPILMQFAAHEVSKTYKDFYLSHEILVEANLACMQKYDLDAVGLISDPCREAEAYGGQFEYLEESVPKCTQFPVQTLADIENLPQPEVTRSVRTADRIQGAALFRNRLGDEVPVIGWIEGPLAEACDLVGVARMLTWLATDPGPSRLLLEKMVPTAKAFARAQIEAGCDIIGIGDAICSQISPRMYVRFVKDLHNEIIKDIQSQGALVKVHICGDITRLLPHLAELQPEIIDLDWMVDMDAAYDILGPEIIRAGNLDPVRVIEQMNPDQVYAHTRNLVEKEQGRPFILSGGCEITPLTPKANLLAMRMASK